MTELKNSTVHFIPLALYAIDIKRIINKCMV
jgi:hypothetical protein